MARNFVNCCVFVICCVFVLLTLTQEIDKSMWATICHWLQRRT